MEVRVMNISKSALWEWDNHIVLLKVRPTNGSKWAALVMNSPTYYVVVRLDKEDITDYEAEYESFCKENLGVTTDEPLFLHDCDFKKLMQGTKFEPQEESPLNTFWYADMCGNERLSRKGLKDLVEKGIFNNVIRNRFKIII